MDIEMKPVTSKCFAAVGHDPATNTLRVQFHSGAVHDYSDFPAEKHGEMMSAVSLGRYFQRHVRDNADHPSRRVA